MRFALALVFLSGCWPYIPGSWEDYDVPEETQLLGRAVWIANKSPLVTDYVDNGAFDAFWLESPSTDWDPMQLITPDHGGCVSGALDWAPLLAVLANPDAPGGILLAGPAGGISLPWLGNPAIFEGLPAAADMLPEAHYSIAEFETAEHGNLTVDDFMIAPGEVEFGGLDLGLMNAGPSDFHVTWDPKVEAIDYVVVNIYAVRNAEILQTVTCTAAPSEGEITVPTDLWNVQPDYWQVERSAVRTSKQRLGDLDVATNTAVSLQELGFYQAQ